MQNVGAVDVTRAESTAPPQRPTGIPLAWKGKTYQWSWEYMDEAGYLKGYTVRYESTEGKKEVIPFFERSNGTWNAGAPEAPRPLFGLHAVSSLASNNAVYVVEGEKCAAACHAVDLPAVTALGGANAAEKTDWKPLARSQRIVVLPDHDRSGERFCQDVIASLARLSGSREVRIARLPGLPEHGDIVDFVRSLLPSWGGYGPIPNSDKQQVAPRVLQAIEECAETVDLGILAAANSSHSEVSTLSSAEEWSEPRPLPRPGGVASPEPYPLDRLPAPLRDAAIEVARFGKVPPAWPAIIGISVIALSIGKKARIVERDGLRHFPSFFHVLIASSGERKSLIFKVMTEPVERWTRDQDDDYQKLLREARGINLAIDAAVNKLRSPAKSKGLTVEDVGRQIAELDAGRQAIPPHPRPYTSNATEERLFQLLHEHHGAHAALSGEGRLLIDAIMGRYCGEGYTGDSIILAGVSGDTITRDRVGGSRGPEARSIHEPCLNLCVMVQPDKFAQFACHPSLRESGAVARVWPVQLPSLFGQRLEEANEPGLNEEVLAPYHALVRQILDHELRLDQQDWPVPTEVALSPGAAEARRLCHNAIEACMGEGGCFEDVQAVASKATSMIARLALVLHVAGEPDTLDRHRSEVDEDTWAAAEEVGLWHLQEAVRVQRLAGEEWSLQKAHRALAWIQENGLVEVITTELTQYGPRPRLKARQAEEVLELLTVHGYLRPRIGQGRRKPVYAVNPALFSRNSQSSQGVV
jgi:uncharacterized protein DUF3987/Toprim domain-containing protein